MENEQIADVVHKIKNEIHMAQANIRDANITKREIDARLTCWSDRIDMLQELLDKLENNDADQ